MGIPYERGRRGEEIAVRYLAAHGYQIKFRNVKIYRGGEIDIVAFDPVWNELVFAEVKSRTSRSFGWPEESMTDRKKQSVRRAAALFFLKHQTLQSLSYRFDVLAIELDEGKAKARVMHYKNIEMA